MRFPHPEWGALLAGMTLPWTPEYWLAQAADAKARAGELNNPSAKREMLLIAAGYESWQSMPPPGRSFTCRSRSHD